MSEGPAARVLTCDGPAGEGIEDLLGRFGLAVVRLPTAAAIPGTYWGAPEAGLAGSTLYLRPDTPVHSALHEACHYVCMDPSRRARLDTDAGGDHLEEAAVCYLQVLLADLLPRLGRDRLFADMDAWGYSFRLGSARAWFEADAEDARGWLLDQGLLDPDGSPAFRLRGEADSSRARAAVEA